ncbi:hypothetical protein NST84_11915 [Paenibacillus sp. FSL R7-0345]|uniref:hypothetical protein n=1 Tax=Paenibacillus sp. FSL R7-0345 TaxID=2954535 RepID=UPI00315B3D82
MKNNVIAILGASLILGFSFIIGCLIISNGDKTGQAVADQARIAQQEAESKELLSLQETAQLLNLQEDQVLNIIKAENAILSNNGVFAGQRLPFFKVDANFMFSRTEVLKWIWAVSSANRIYQGEKIIQ